MAEYGIQIWNEGGNLIVDTSTRLGRIVESVIITTPSSSSMNVPLLVEGDPFAFYVTGTIGGNPNIAISGTLVSWEFPSGFTVGSLVIGVY